MLKQFSETGVVDFYNFALSMDAKMRDPRCAATHVCVCVSPPGGANGLWPSVVAPQLQRGFCGRVRFVRQREEGRAHGGRPAGGHACPRRDADRRRGRRYAEGVQDQGRIRKDHECRRHGAKWWRRRCGRCLTRASPSARTGGRASSGSRRGTRGSACANDVGISWWCIGWTWWCIRSWRGAGWARRVSRWARRISRWAWSVSGWPWAWRRCYSWAWAWAWEMRRWQWRQLCVHAFLAEPRNEN